MRKKKRNVGQISSNSLSITDLPLTF